VVNCGDQWCAVALTGTFPRSIDQKLRVAIPKRLREALHCPFRGVLYVAPGTDGSLVVYTEEAFERLAERLAQAPPTRHLVELAQLRKEVVLLGVQDHLEVWGAERWEAYLAERQARYDEIAESAFEGPRPA
jgi:MraZ protein